MRELAHAYVETALLLGRHRPGLVDASLAAPALVHRVGRGPLPTPGALVDRAASLRAAAGGGEPRRAWLAAQARGLELTARCLAGARPGLREQARVGYDVTPAPAPPGEHAAAHAALGRLLPGDGPLAERLERHRRATAVPPEALPRAAEAVLDVLRERCRDAYGLPADERVTVRVVAGAPWGGFSAGAGRLRSEVRLSGDAPVPVASLVRLLAHEAYPGHHLHRCLTEQGLAARPETAVSVEGTPECVVAEGVGELALAASGLDWPAALAGAFPGVDLQHAAAVAAAAEPLSSVDHDAALLLAGGAPVGQVRQHLRRWGLLTPQRAERRLRFLADRGAYALTYTEGARLLGAWLAARPAGEPLAVRFRRLLVEPVTPAGLRAELAGQAAGHAC